MALYNLFKNEIYMEVWPKAKAEKHDLAMLVYEDLALIYIYDSTPLTNEVVRALGISILKLNEDAIINTCVKDGARVIELDKEIPIYALTTVGGRNGAKALFYPNIAKIIADTLKITGYAILPSSTDELLIIPDAATNAGTVPAEILEGAVKAINNNPDYAENNFLSNSVYHYDAKNEIFELASGWEKRMAKSQE